MMPNGLCVCVGGVAAWRLPCSCFVCLCDCGCWTLTGVQSTTFPATFRCWCRAHAKRYYREVDALDKAARVAPLIRRIKKKSETPGTAFYDLIKQLGKKHGKRARSFFQVRLWVCRALHRGAACVCPCLPCVCVFVCSVVLSCLLCTSVCVVHPFCAYMCGHGTHWRG